MKWKEEQDNPKRDKNPGRPKKANVNDEEERNMLELRVQELELSWEERELFRHPRMSVPEDTSSQYIAGAPCKLTARSRALLQRTTPEPASAISIPPPRWFRRGAGPAESKMLLMKYHSITRVITKVFATERMLWGLACPTRWICRISWMPCLLY